MNLCRLLRRVSGEVALFDIKKVALEFVFI
jgi:hypothetical protein